jgi:methyl-accepting chemotaxis protein
MANDIKTRISLEGGAEIKNSLEDIGKSGADAFKKIGDAGRDIKFDQAANSAKQLGDNLQQVGQAGVEATGKLKDSVDQVRSSINESDLATRAWSNSWSFIAGAITGALAGIITAFKGGISSMVEAGGTASEKLDEAATKLRTNFEDLQHVRAAITGLGGDVGDFEKAFARITQETEKWKGALDGAFNKAGAFGVGIGGLNNSLISTVDTLHGVSRQFEVMAEDAENGEKAIVTVIHANEKLASSTSGVSGALDVIRQLGINLRQFAAADYPTKVDLLRDAIQKITDPAKQAAIAAKLFGDQWQSALETLRNSKTDWDEAIKRADQLGRLLTVKENDSLSAFKKSATDLNEALTATQQKLGAIFAPPKTAFNNFLTDLIDKNRQLILDLASTKQKIFDAFSTSELKPAIEGAFKSLLSGIDQAFTKDNISEIFRVATEYAKAFGEVITNFVAPGIRLLHEGMNAAAEAINQLFGTNFNGKALEAALVITKLVGGFFLLRSAIGPVLTILEALMAVFGTVGGALVGILGLIAFWDDFQKAGEGALSAIKAALPELKSALDSFLSGDYSAAWEKIKQLGIQAFDAIEQKIVSAKGPLAEFFTGVKDAFATLKFILDGLASVINSVFGTKLTGTTLGFYIALLQVLGVFQSLVPALLAFQALFGKLGASGAILIASFIAFTRLFPDIAAAVAKCGEAFKAFLNGDIEGGINKLKEAFSGFWENLQKEGPGTFALLAAGAVLALRTISGAFVSELLPLLTFFTRWPIVIGAALASLVALFSGDWETIKNIVKGAVDFIVNVLTGNWKEAARQLNEAFDWEKLKQGGSAAAGAIGLAFVTMIAGVKLAIAGMSLLWSPVKAAGIVAATELAAALGPAGLIALALGTFLGITAVALWETYKQDVFRILGEIAQKQKEASPALAKAQAPDATLFDKFLAGVEQTGRAIKFWILDPMIRLGSDVGPSLSDLGKDLDTYIIQPFKKWITEGLFGDIQKIPGFFSDAFKLIEDSITGMIGFWKNKLIEFYDWLKGKSNEQKPIDDKGTQQSVDQLGQSAQTTGQKVQTALDLVKQFFSTLGNIANGTNESVDQTSSSLDKTTNSAGQTRTAIQQIGDAFAGGLQGSNALEAGLERARQKAIEAKAQLGGTFDIKGKAVVETADEFNRKITDARQKTEEWARAFAAGLNQKGGTSQQAIDNVNRSLDQEKEKAATPPEQSKWDRFLEGLKGAFKGAMNEFGVSSAQAAEDTNSKFGKVDFKSVTDAAKSAFSDVKAAGTEAADALKNKFGDISIDTGKLDGVKASFEGLVAPINSAVEAIKNFFSAATDAVSQSDAFKTAVDGIKAALEALNTVWKTTFETIGATTAIVGGITQAIGLLVEQLGTLAGNNAFGVLIEGFGKLIQMVGQLEQVLGALAIATGSAFDQGFTSKLDEIRSKINGWQEATNQVSTSLASLSQPVGAIATAFDTIRAAIAAVIADLAIFAGTIADITIAVGSLIQSLGQLGGIFGLPIQALGVILQLVGNLIGQVSILIALLSQLAGGGGGSAPESPDQQGTPTKINAQGGGGLFQPLIDGANTFTQTLGPMQSALAQVDFASFAQNGVQAFSSFEQAAQQSVNNVIQTFGNLNSISEVFNSIGANLNDSMGQVTSSIAQMIQNMVDSINSQLDSLIQKINEVAQAAANAASSGGGGGGGGGGGDSGGDFAGFASGGPVFGPGTGTSDSILARLSNGEFVMTAAAVRRFGLGFLMMLNQLKLPKFATGGPVNFGGALALPTLHTPVGNIGGGGPMTQVNLTIGSETIEGLLAPQQVLDKMKSAASISRMRSAGRKAGWVA